MPSSHHHPQPGLNRLTQIGALLLLVIMVLAALGQVVLALQGFGLLFASALITLLLIAPVIMLTTATPPVQVAPEGITLLPVVWPRRFVAWDQVAAIKDYPLLPHKDAEVGRRALQGRRKYRAPEGKMLIIPSLPFVYRLTGLFAGEGFTPVIALTNRAHRDYDVLISKVMAWYDDSRP
jgi:hypothetical protein